MKALSHFLYLILLVSMSSCCFGPWYYQKSGQMRVKGFVPWYGKYDVYLEEADPPTFHKIDNFHAVDSNHVYVLSHSWNSRHVDVLEEADPATFEVLSKNRYTRDARHVWYKTNLIQEADSKTFEVLNENYGRTDSLLFFRDVLVKGADPETVIFHKYYIEDKNDVYWQLQPLHVSDRESFTFVPEKKMNELVKWAKDKNYVYYLQSTINDDSVAVQIPIADYHSFEALDMYYARDKVQVYNRGSVLTGAEPSSFVWLGDDLYGDAKSVFYKDQRVCDYSGAFKNFHNGYFTDGAQVYYADKILGDIDLATFSVEGNIAKDANQVYYNGVVAEGVDPKTIHRLNRPYMADSTHVFYDAKIMEGADPVSFEILRDMYSRDKNHVFYKDEMIKGADAATFELLREGYAKDKSHFYYDSQIIAEADYDSFRPLHTPYAKDDNHVYYKGDVLQDADYETFKSLEYFYAQDKNHVYYLGETVVDADPATFEVLPNYQRDQNHIFYKGKMVEGADISTFKFVKWNGFHIFEDKYRKYFLE